VRAALALGAQAAQIGTAFLACEESNASDDHRRWLFSERAEKTTLTRAFSGRLARGLRNEWTERMAAHAPGLPPFPVTSWLTSRMRAAALEAGRTEWISLWGGQIAPNLKHRTAARLMTSLLEDIPT